jgi:cytochrome c553
MKRIKASQLRNVAAAGLHTGLLASALAAAAMIGGAHAAETRGGVAGKVAYCLDCHGAAGQVIADTIRCRALPGNNRNI